MKTSFLYGRGGRGGRGHRGHHAEGRNTDRKTFLYALKTKDYAISTPQKAKLLVRTMEAFEDPTRLLLDLTDSRCFGYALIRNIIEQCDMSSPDGGLSITLLSFFLQDIFDKPMMKRSRDSVLLHITNTPFFLRQLSEYVLEEATESEGITLCKYVLTIIQSSLEMLKNEDIRSLTNALHEKGFPGADKVFQIMSRNEESALHTMERLKAVVGQARDAKAVTAAEMRPPGDRYENDLVHYREISIMPTIDEITCDEMEYLPLSNGSNRFIEDDEEWYLDSMFRLLRYDSLNPIREAFAQDVPVSAKNRTARYLGCRVAGVYVANKETPAILLRFDAPPNLKLNKDKMRDFWKKKSMLTYSAVICLRRNGQPFCFATITLTKLEWLTADGDKPMIGVSCGSDTEMLKLLRNFNPGPHDLENIACDMLVISSSFFASVNVLKGLQKMLTVPLSEYLVPNHSAATRRALRERNLDHPDPNDEMKDAPRYMKHKISFPGTTDSIPFDITSGPIFVQDCMNRTTLDESQANALHHALTHRVSLIQGPPGTGKTFVGSLLARIILKCDPHVKILCLCYTNHALDQFLEYLIEGGVTNLVRIGSRSKSPIVDKFNLNAMASSDRFRSHDERRCFAQASGRCEELREEIEILQEEIETYENPGQMKWFDVCRIIDFDILPQFQMPRLDDGFQSGDKKTNDPGYLWNIWITNKFLPGYLHDRFNWDYGFIWELTLPQREDMMRGWLHEHLHDKKITLIKMFKRYNSEHQALQVIKNGAKRAVLAHARVIGATTSGATNCKELLDSCGVKVILVEEAGEVLEAHVVTSLTASVEHLILIGDHKQLRPKVDSYDLQVVSGKGYDLDRSMFERLVLHSGLKPSVLVTQRRMQPQISQMIRFTYPSLRDHETVHEYPNVKGLLKNVMFLDHQKAETSINGHAFTNMYEVEICVQITRLLLLNGYKAEQLVILTPYLGQLMKLQSHIRSELADVQALISEIDRENLIQQGLWDDDLDDDDDEGVAKKSGMAKSATENKNLRTATVDNFQGEEADVVIISLVRSNSHGQVGFLKEPERVNVLLSRAKHGMIIVGNATTLKISKKASHVWQPILDYLEDEECIVDGLPAFCQLHPTDIVHLKTPDDFKMLRPNGGCSKICDFRMNCGHACTQFCHVVDQAHDHQKCYKPCLRVPVECKSGHRCPKLCYEECGQCKVPMSDIELICGHTRKVTCHDVSNEARMKNLRCLVQDVRVVIPECGHHVTISCVLHQKPSSEWPCLAACTALLDCGHACSDTCYKCRKRGQHSETCRQPCQRTLFCGHICGQTCHQQCGECNMPCYQSCAHSKCPLKCCDVCSSCVESCAWECEHQGKCELLCGAPCTRLPCDLRCSKRLTCGHRCPTVCGEVCPSHDFCQECGTKKNDIPDIIEMNPYSACDLDSDPICVLSCGHFYTISTLDGHMQLAECYYRDGGDDRQCEGTWAGPRALSEAEQNNQPKSCPACKAVISGVYRYGRAIRNSELHFLERKFRFKNDELLLQAEQKVGENRLLLLEKLLSDMITKSPTRKLFDAMGGTDQMEVAKPPSQSFLQVSVSYGKALSGASEAWIKEKGGAAEKHLMSALLLADSEEYLTKSADLRLAIVKLILQRYPDSVTRKANGYQEIMVEMLEWIGSVESPTNLLDVQRAEAAKLEKAVKSHISKTEINSILSAMESGTGYARPGSWSAHWYECRNGHPYFIGECGQAMQESQCPECGAVVGGENHTLSSSNQQATDLFRFTSQVE